MGSPKHKLLALILLVVVSTMGYQNCGNQFQGNGDPYEGTDPVISIPPGDGPVSGNDGQLPQEFQVEMTCPTSSSNAKFKKVEFGTLMAVDTFRITDIDGVQRSFGWNSSRPLYNVNTPWDSNITLVSIELQNKVATIHFRSGGVDLSESLPCL